MKLIDRIADLFTPRAAPAVYADTTLGNPAPWLLESMGATQTLTGEVLTKKGAEAIPAYWACKDRIESDVAGLPLDAYRRGEGGAREKARETPQHRVVRVRPNPEQTPDAFYRMLMFHKLSWGDGYAEIERLLPRGTPGYIRSPPVALWPLLSDRTSVERFEGKKILVTRVREMSSTGELGPAERRVLLPGEFIHLPGRSFNGFRSYNPLECAPNVLALSKAQIDWLASFYDGDAMAGAWAKIPSLGPIGRGSKAKMDLIRDYIREQVGGMRRSHRLGILPEGAELEKSVVTPREQELVAGMNLSGIQICQLMKMKPHKIGLLNQANYSTLTEENQSYLGDCIKPHTEPMAQAFGWELFGAASEEFFLEHNYKSILQATPLDEAKTIRELVQGTIMTPAEGRQVLNMNPAPPEQGLENFLAQVNQVPMPVLAAMAEQAGSEDGARALYRMAMGLPAERPGLPPQIVRAEVAAPERPAIESREARAQRSANQRNRLRLAWEPIFTRSAERYVSQEVRAARRALEQAGDDLRAFMAALERFWESFPAAIRRELGPVFTGYGAATADAITEELGAPVAGPAYDAAVETVLAAAIGRHIVKSRGGMRGVLQDHAGGGAVEALGARFDQWGNVRPGKIGLSESVRTGSRLAQEAYQAGGIREKIWVTFGDSCDLCQELSGQVVGISGSFLAAGDTLDPKKEGTEPMTVDRNIRTAPLHGGCTCTIGAA